MKEYNAKEDAEIDSDIDHVAKVGRLELFFRLIGLAIGMPYLVFGILQILHPKILPPRVVGWIIIIAGTGFMMTGFEIAGTFKKTRSYNFLRDEYFSYHDRMVAFFERESKRASGAAKARHKFNIERKDRARQFYCGEKFATTAAAGRAIANKFHVEPSVAERWIRSWRKEDLALQGDESSAEK